MNRELLVSIIKRVSGLELQHLTTLPGKMREDNC